MLSAGAVNPGPPAFLLRPNVGWQITTDSMTLRVKKTLPGLGGFFMIGQWVNPGGGLGHGEVCSSAVMTPRRKYIPEASANGASLGVANLRCGLAFGPSD